MARARPQGFSKTWVQAKRMHDDSLRAQDDPQRRVPLSIACEFVAADKQRGHFYWPDGRLKTLAEYEAWLAQQRGPEPPEAA